MLVNVVVEGMKFEFWFFFEFLVVQEKSYLRTKKLVVT